MLKYVIYYVFFDKIFGGFKKSAYLCIRFRTKSSDLAVRILRKSSLKDLHKQRSSTRSEPLSIETLIFQYLQAVWV